MTDYVLVHGGFCDGWYWGETTTRLEKQGHRVHIADLPSTGTDPATLGGLADDVAEVRRLVDAADKPAVLVGHSYGGLVITELADHPRVAHTVYVSAFWPTRGESLLDIFPPAEWMVLSEDRAAVRITDDLAAAHAALCADLDTARVPEWHASLMWSSTSDMATPSTSPTRTHPTTYVVLERDRAISSEAQEAMAAQADHVERLATGHVPQLTDPEGLAAVLNRVQL